MLAMNVSSEVLQGFTVVEKSLIRTTEQTTEENRSLYDTFEREYAANSKKAGEWYKKAAEVKEKSQALYDMIAEVKRLIAIEADGSDADMGNIKNKESLEAASQVMLSPVSRWGDRLYEAINSYREEMLAMVEEPHKKAVMAANLSTEVPANDNKGWKEYYFEEMPVVAAMTFLTKLQGDIRYTEGEVLHTLMSNIDARDVRVNSLEARVIPRSLTVVRGNRFTADIIMAAIDTTQKPAIIIDGEKNALTGNRYERVCSQAGSYTLKGSLQTAGKDGSVIKRPFEQKYTVIEPTATVSAEMTNVLYAGYDNILSISVPGIALSQIEATMDGGAIRKIADGRYIAKPAVAGKTATVTVFSLATGQRQQMAQYTFRVRRLPEPTAYLTLADDKGMTERWYGGTIAKKAIADADRLHAAVDDGILDIPYHVNAFETVFFDKMGNAVTVPSDGSSFSPRQKEVIGRMGKGKRFYITKVMATGPDGIQRKLKTSTEVIIR